MTAIILNLRNWVYFFIRIGVMAYHSQLGTERSSTDSHDLVQPDTYLENISKNSLKLVKALDFATFGVVVVFGSLMIKAMV